jgi:hypothetical protein
MIYTTTILDRQEGDLKTISLGEYLTISELAQRYGMGPRQFRRVLDRMGLLQQVATSGRRLLHPDAVATGYGKTLWPKASTGKHKHPFDVISPLGQAYIADQWKQTLGELLNDGQRPATLAVQALEEFEARRSKPMSLLFRVTWLLDHFPDLTQQDIADCLNADPSMVSRYAKARRKRRASNRELLVELTADRLSPVMSWAARSVGYTLPLENSSHDTGEPTGNHPCT